MALGGSNAQVALVKLLAPAAVVRTVRELRPTCSLFVLESLAAVASSVKPRPSAPQQGELGLEAEATHGPAAEEALSAAQEARRVGALMRRVSTLLLLPAPPKDKGSERALQGGAPLPAPSLLVCHHELVRRGGEEGRWGWQRAHTTLPDVALPLMLCLQSRQAHGGLAHMVFQPLCRSREACRSGTAGWHRHLETRTHSRPSSRTIAGRWPATRPRRPAGRAAAAVRDCAPAGEQRRAAQARALPPRAAAQGPAGRLEVRKTVARGGGGGR